MSENERNYSKVKSEEFNADQMQQDPILQYFGYSHLKPELQATSAAFATMAKLLIDTIPRNAERTVALRKLLETKDAAVRARL